MPYLKRGQENTIEKLNWFITLGGTLTDVDDIGFRIFDIQNGLPGTQIFPATEGEYHSALPSGRFGTGSYYAYDSTTGAGWAPPESATLGTHRIEWRWRLTDQDNYLAYSEDFEVYSNDGTAPEESDTYITVADIRAQGLSAEDYSDEDVLASIELWQTFIDRACRQWFKPRVMVLELDGNDSDIMMFGVPIVDIEYMKINGCDSELNTDYYTFYNGYEYPDDRRNPRIALKNGTSYDIYSGSANPRKFLKGKKNQEIKGTFGFVESDGSVPKLIQRALTKLVIEKLTDPLYGSTTDPSAAPPIVGALLEEWTDGHKVKYDVAGGQIDKRKPGLTGITQDQEILDIIRLYRAPLGVATPSHPSHM